MSKANVELVREMYDAFWRRRDSGVFTALVSPDIEWVSFFDVEPRRGPEEVGAFFSDWLTTWTDHEVDYEFFDAGDRVVVLCHLKGKGRGSGVEVESSIGQVWTLRDGKLVHQQMFRTPEEALEAAGLSAER
jgi:ketosteroid isomerase-like protein